MSNDNGYIFVGNTEPNPDDNEKWVSPMKFFRGSPDMNYGKNLAMTPEEILDELEKSDCDDPFECIFNKFGKNEKGGYGCFARYPDGKPGEDQGCVAHQAARLIREMQSVIDGSKVEELEGVIAAKQKEIDLYKTLLSKERGVTGDVDMSLYDCEEIHKNCTVQVWKNSVTGSTSVGWWENE